MSNSTPITFQDFDDALSSAITSWLKIESAKLRRRPDTEKIVRATARAAKGIQQRRQINNREFYLIFGSSPFQIDAGGADITIAPRQQRTLVTQVGNFACYNVEMIAKKSESMIEALILEGLFRMLDPGDSEQARMDKIANRVDGISLENGKYVEK